MKLKHPLAEGSLVLLESYIDGDRQVPETPAKILESYYETAGAYLVSVDPQDEHDSGLRWVGAEEITHKRCWMPVED